MSGWRAVLVPLICGLITVAIGMANLWLGILVMPIMLAFSKSLNE